jgi:hypothetical protein
MSRVFRPAAVFALALALPLAAHAQAQRTEREAFTWSGRIPAGQSINVKNMNGGITVGRASGDRVEVTATKTWRRGDPDVVRFDVQKYGRNQESVVICALWGERSECNEREYRSRGDGSTRNNDVSVAFRILVPAGVHVSVSTINGGVTVNGATAEVHASSVNGGVTVTSSGGPVTANTVNGAVRARMGSLQDARDLSFSSVNGAVLVELPPDANADVELSTVNGSLRTDFEIAVQGRLSPRNLRGRIGGQGGPRVKVSTVNGSVELRRGS